MKFIDTNIFLYAIDKSNPDKQAVASTIVAEALRPGSDCLISVQVLSEFASVALRKMKLPARIVLAMLQELQKKPCADITPSIPSRAVEIQELYEMQFYDSQLIAMAERYRCVEFVSEDINDGQSYCGVRVVNPFKDL